MIPLWIKTVAGNKAARIVGAVAGALLLLWLARCDGARHQSARDRQDTADSQAKTSEASAKHDANIADSVRAVLADSMRDLRAAKAKADSDAARALSHLGRITVVGPAAPPGDSSTNSIAPGRSNELTSEPDTTRYATIQRQGDPRLYVVPQFVVDLGAELRRAIADKADEAAKAERNLALAAIASAKDSGTIRDLRDALKKRTDAETIAKSNAGQECRIAFVIHCPPRKVVAGGAFLIGLAGGAALHYELTKK